MVKRKAKNLNKQKKPSPKDGDRILHFVRQRSFGVVLLALMSAGGGWLVWHIRDCLAAQKAQIAATRKAWTNFRVANQKHASNLRAFMVRSEIFTSQVETGHLSPGILEQHQKAGFEISQLLITDCHARKATSNEFATEVRALGTLFSFDVPTFQDPLLCDDLASASEKLRFLSDLSVPTSPNQDVKEVLKEVKAVQASLQQVTSSTAETDKKLNTIVEAKLLELETRNLFRRIAHCL